MFLEFKSDPHGSKPCSQTPGDLLGQCLAASASDRRLRAVRLLEVVFLCVCLAVTRTEACVEEGSSNHLSSPTSSTLTSNPNEQMHLFLLWKK